MDRLRTWQGITLGTLFTGYMGYYVCRSNLSIATPLILAEYKDQGFDKECMGGIVSVGVLLYAVGKTLNGVLAEYLGGRGVFLLGMIASALCTVLFAFTPDIAPSLAPLAGWLGLPLAVLLPMYAVWSLNRFVQSMGWGGLVQIASRWFPPGRMATVMGVLCMSYLLGDAIARAYLSQALREFPQLGWRGLFSLSAATLFAISVLNLFLLKSRPSVLGLPEAPPPPGNVYGADTGDARMSPWALLKPLLTNFTFWLVCLMNMGLTLIRETFNFWTPTYLNEVVRIDVASSGMASLVFPLAGAAASLLCGWLVDQLGGRFGLVVIASLLLLVAALGVISVVPVEHNAPLAMTLIALVAFAVMGPYTFCSGVLAVKLGGQRAGATSAGIIDTLGYLGAVLAGSGVGRVAQSYGWSTAFLALAGIASLTLCVAAVYAVRSKSN